MTSWKVVAASIAGPHHVRDGLPCQDAHTYRLQGDYLIAVISDGAGSACYSQLGSQAIADTLVQVLAEADLQGLEAQTLQALVEAGVEQCRHNLVEAHPDTQLADFHATLLGVVAGPEGGFFFQIGDGLGAAIQEQRWAPCLLALPENGEFAEETFFFTQDSWRKHLRLTAIPAEHNQIILVTDGAYSFTYKPSAQGLDEAFVGPVCRYLDHQPADVARLALEQTLNHPNAQRISGDDKTFLWAKRSS